MEQNFSRRLKSRNIKTSFQTPPPPPPFRKKPPRRDSEPGPLFQACFSILIFKVEFKFILHFIIFGFYFIKKIPPFPPPPPPPPSPLPPKNHHSPTPSPPSLYPPQPQQKLTHKNTQRPQSQHPDPLPQPRALRQSPPERGPQHEIQSRRPRGLRCGFGGESAGCESGFGCLCWVVSPLSPDVSVVRVLGGLCVCVCV